MLFSFVMQPGKQGDVLQSLREFLFYIFEAKILTVHVMG
jgi:hypothetical protein